VKTKTLIRSILFLAATILFAGSLAYAAAPAPAPVEPDPAANPMLAEFIKTGAKVYYMGEHSGLQGWFITKSGQVQIAYAPPDNQSVVIGVLFDAQGNSVTSQQMKTLYDSNKEVNAFLNSAGNQPAVQAMGIPSGQMMPSPAASSMLPVAVSPGEQLLQALQNAAGVDVGAASAPKLYMVIDPNCPHCHATWQALRAAVFGGKLQVRLVPIDAQGNPDSERAAAQFLHTADPLNAWDKYVGGDKTQLAGNPDAAVLGAVHSNRELIEAWHIDTTPYMVYRAKDGQAKIVRGEPEHADAIINDVGS
jgi:thiol:disulfide interchange protein DsbG